MCPFQFLKLLATAFGLHKPATTARSVKYLQNSNAYHDLVRWRRFVEENVLNPTADDVARAHDLLLSNWISEAKYSHLEQRLSRELISAREFVVGELVALAQFSRKEDDVSLLKYANNVCFSFHEIIAILEIALTDLTDDLMPTRSVLQIVRKVVLNNATQHNSIGGGMLHLYMKYANEQKGPVFVWEGKAVRHADGFVTYAARAVEHYSHELADLLRRPVDDLEYQLQLLYMRDQKGVETEDFKALAHFLVNYFHGRGRVGCPYLRGKYLIGFVDGILKPFA